VEVWFRCRQEISLVISGTAYTVFLAAQAQTVLLIELLSILAALAPTARRLRLWADNG
jgi:hypothetical protein